MTPDRLRDAYASHTRAHAPLDRRSCPSPEALESVAMNAADATDRTASRTKTYEHLLSCRFCRQEFDLLRTVAVAERETERDHMRVGLGRGDPTRWPRSRLLLVASILIVATVGGETWRRLSAGNASEPVMRDGVSDVALVSPVSPEDVYSAASLRQFIWRAVPGANAYVVEILDTTGNVLVSKTAADTVATLTENETNIIAAAAVVDWMVTAQRGDGNERRSSLTRIRVRR